MTFAALAIVVLLGVLGVMAGSIYFWIFFTTLHVSVCLFLSVQIYYLGRWRLGKSSCLILTVTTVYNSKPYFEI